MEENGGAGSNFLNLRPVAAEEYGEGSPYAPENWPEEGDIWGWRTGRRVAPTGLFQDRYLYVPLRLCRSENQGSSRRRLSFASKLSLERYIKSTFPQADLEAFFASFSWKIPAMQTASPNGNLVPIAAVPLQQVAHEEQSESETDTVKCKAGNKECDSLILEQAEGYSPAMPCDICCSEPGFCGNCCCILCGKTVSSAYGGYSYIKCQVNTVDGICGHLAHMECALRACMAGTVGSSIGLDAEYHCRRCDGRTDLISHVKRLLQTCKGIDSDEDIQKKILSLGACLLRGSQKATAKELLSHIELAISKLECGTKLEDIRKVNDKLTANYVGLSDHGNDMMEFTVNGGGPVNVRIGTESDDDLPLSIKLEAEIDEVLHSLRKSQEFEYKLAQERLQAHKTYLKNLYQQLDSEKSELACQKSARSDALFHAVTKRREQIRQEMMKFETMKKVANGFGRTSKDILKEHFGLDDAD